ncbi:transporter substrate-binding domain-containing protein [Rhodobacter ferrooxidans]|uniref:Extracellular solute-binding protein family 3 n=1 Tax=Rhodobacter ferrooxidans TaxID=371731 RepID=C8S5L3_9RHOB|nr:transporter substrate-binding domain-containing protein [Rhodobacter sp. SW2]EEW23715.1 extracellular solute-binding protein family 3 [Rhodobacter sp. SW2]
MRLATFFRQGTLSALLALFAFLPAFGADLDEIRHIGKIRHIGIRYANFVTGAGDGFDVDLMKGFARYIGVDYELVYSDFYSVIRDTLGKDIVNTPDGLALQGNFPVRGDVISAGFTHLPWREKFLLFSEPTFPSQVLLVAPANSRLSPIQPSGNLASDIAATKALIGTHSLLVMEKTCLDPSGYGIVGNVVDLRKLTSSTNLNEMVPAMLDGTADIALLDVPDVIRDLDQWSGQIKILGPISEPQVLATAFPKDAENLRDAFNNYLRQIKQDGTYDALVDKYYPGVRSFFSDFF